MVWLFHIQLETIILITVYKLLKVKTHFSSISYKEDITSMVNLMALDKKYLKTVILISDSLNVMFFKVMVS
jgi:hypothetical protein